MKLSLIASSLLVAAAYAKLPSTEVTALKAFDSTPADKAVTKAAVTILKDATGSENINEAKGYFTIAKLNASITAEDDNAEQIATILEKFDSSIIHGLTEANLVKVISKRADVLGNLKNFGNSLFASPKIVKALLELQKAKGTTAQFLNNFSVEQLDTFMQNIASFDGELHDTIFLNALAAHLKSNVKRQEFLSTVTAEYIDLAHKIKKTAFTKEVIANLPSNYLEETTVPAHVDEAASWTAAHVASLNKNIPWALGFKYTALPLKMQEHINPSERALLNQVLTTALPKNGKMSMTTAQWNTILSKTKGCKVINSKAKFDDINAIVVNAECFAALDADLQIELLFKSDNLPADILSRMDKSKVLAWHKGQKHGLAVLPLLPKKELIRELGTHEDVAEEDYPLLGMSAKELLKNKDFKEIIPFLPVKAVNAYTLEMPEKLSEVKDIAEFAVIQKGIFKALNGITIPLTAAETRINPKPVKTFWNTLDKELAIRLFSPEYSVLASEMTVAAYNEIPADVRAVIPGHAIVSLPFFLDLDATLLGAEAFAYAGESHAQTLVLSKLSAEQLPLLSSKAATSYFAKASPAAVVAGVKGRENLLTAQQVAALPNETVKAVFTKESTPVIAAASTTRMTAAQLKDISTEVIAAFTAEQAKLIGSEVKVDALSAASVLLANQASMNKEALAALHARFPGSSAVSRTAVSAALVAAVAALAVLA